MNQRITQLLLGLGLIAMIVAACGGNEPTDSPTPAPKATSTESTVEFAENDAPDQTENQPSAEDGSSTDEEQNAPLAEEDTGEAQSDAVAPDVPVKFQLEAWADNWFAAYLGEALIVEDSVSINTERSFNAETATFEAAYPLTLNFVLKDFKENDTGLEYIGSPRQQMGDGGFIMQLTDLSTGDVVAVSDAEWACAVIHEAPLDKACEQVSDPEAGIAPCEFIDLGEPEGWKAANFDDRGWTATTVHTVNDVGPKDGYNQIVWDARAQLIWGPDLETDNTVLCRATVESP